MKKKYIKRLFDETLKFTLKTKGCVLIVGPKWCGKSTTAEQQAKSVIYMQNPDTKKDNIDLAKTSAHLFLNTYEKPLLIDEWQEIPFIWDAIRFEIDQNNDFGQYLLTGSSTPVDSNLYSHTGVGRIVKKMMRPMSLFESLDSTGEVSLMDLFNNKFNPSKNNKSLLDYAYYVCRGGWPLAIGEDKDIALSQVKDYYEDLVSESVFKVPGLNLRKNVQIARLVMKSYCRNIGTQCPNSTLINDVDIDEDTLNKYLSALESIYVIEESLSWNINARSKTAIRVKPTRYLIDPSIACATLGLGPEGLIKNIRTFGFLFENLVIRDLRIYADYLGARVYHYKDKLDREVDAVIQFDNDDYALIEIKLGNKDSIDEAAKKLITLNNEFSKFKAPSFLMIVTAGNIAYKREDGVYVVPIGMLKN